MDAPPQPAAAARTVDSTEPTARLLRPPAPSGTVGRSLSWMWGHGFRFLFVLDAVALYAAMLAINVYRFGFDWPTYPVSHYLVGFAGATAIQLLVNYFAGLYEREPRLGTPPWAPRVTLAMVFGTALDGFVVLFTERYLMPRANLVALLLIGTVALVINRHLSSFMARRRRGPARVLLVGNLEAIDLARDHLDDRPAGSVATVVGEVEDVNDLLDMVAETRPTDIMLLDLAAFETMFPEPLSSLDDGTIGIHQRVGAHETLLGLRSVRQIAGLPFTRVRTHTLSPHQAHLKRLFDVVVLVVLSPVILLTLGLLALWVLIRAGRPVIYRQERVGQDNRPFVLVKFRTMRRDAERDGPQLSKAGDERVIAGLSWMRAARADELPQVWNVLRGEMSLVGPRPERPEMIEEIEREVAGYARRHFLVPGLTGLAQVHGRYNTHPDYKLGYDLQYAVNWSLLMDLQILVRTIWTVLTGRV